MLKYNDEVLHEDDYDTDITLIADTVFENFDDQLVLEREELPDVIQVEIYVKDLRADYQKPDPSSWDSPEDYYGGWQIGHDGFVATLIVDDIVVANVDACQLYSEDKLEEFLMLHLEDLT